MAASDFFFHNDCHPPPPQMLGHYVDLLSRGSPSPKTLLPLLSSLLNFLSAIYGSQVAAREKPTAPCHVWGAARGLATGLKGEGLGKVRGRGEPSYSFY